MSDAPNTDELPTDQALVKQSDEVAEAHQSTKSKGFIIKLPPARAVAFKVVSTVRDALNELESAEDQREALRLIQGILWNYADDLNGD